jgi:hypothetical protein
MHPQTSISFSLNVKIQTYMGSFPTADTPTCLITPYGIFQCAGLEPARAWSTSDLKSLPLTTRATLAICLIQRIYSLNIIFFESTSVQGF